MQNPVPAHLVTRDAVRANGWLAEARDDDGHLISLVSPQGSDAALGAWIRECHAGGLRITVFPKSGKPGGDGRRRAPDHHPCAEEPRLRPVGCPPIPQPTTPVPPKK
jgi:hypothetical protein